MTPSDYDSQRQIMIHKGYTDILDKYASDDRLRHIPAHRNDSDLIDLTSNDYMGLASMAGEWLDEFMCRFPRVPMTASASRLLAGNQQIFAELEKWLTYEYGKPALLFNSGYHANVGIVSALNIPGTLWAADKLIHASVIDGLRLAGAESLRWRHNDTAHLSAILKRNHDRYDRIIVVCESVYSMDGDIAPLLEIAALKREFPKMMLYVDEAHALGVFGPRGRGICAALDMLHSVDILVGTLGKACASSGAFVIADDEFRDWLVNSSRSLIFSTALPPACAAWSLLMLEKLAVMHNEREHLAKISSRFRCGLEQITGQPNPSQSPIVPMLTGDAAKAVALSKRLESKGILALPIRRPTVPPGGERIRFSLHAGLSTEDIDRILNIIRAIYHQHEN